MKDALILRATNFSSSYFENKGNGEFVIRSLPIQAQFSAVQSFYINDFNKDGNMDILLGGNFFSPDFMTGRYDASIGVVMLGNGKGNFKPVEQAVSGIHFTGDVRSIVEIKVGKEKSLIIGANTNKLELYGLQASR